MPESNTSLLTLLHASESLPTELGDLSTAQMAHLYVTSAQLTSILEFINEQLWLRDTRDSALADDACYAEALTELFDDELAPSRFLLEPLATRGARAIDSIASDAAALAERVMSAMMERPREAQRDFALCALEEMTTHFLHEEQMQEGRPLSLGHKGPRLYRTFDALDRLFELDYTSERTAVVETRSPERLYRGSGVHVQSGYSTILLALHHLALKPGSTVIDLGSGFGRVGLACALLRPDVAFIGYEYVPHRVDISNATSHLLGLQDSVVFKTQDLASETFQIPEADVYYLYDPFTEDTYRYVLAQIVDVSRSRRIAVVTKGNARGWLLDIAQQHGWPEPKRIDSGNLCIFYSA